PARPSFCQATARNPTSNLLCSLSGAVLGTRQSYEITNAQNATTKKRGPYPSFLSTGQKKCEGSVAQEIRALRRWLRRRIKVHPHMLRHSCGLALANKERDTRLIQNYLGHRNITHTQIYTRRHRGVHQSSSTLLFLRNGNVTIA